MPAGVHLLLLLGYSLVGAGHPGTVPTSPPPQGFNWTLFIQSVLSSVKIELLPDEEVVVYGIPYLQKLESIIDVFSARCGPPLHLCPALPAPHSSSSQERAPRP